ncbi:hypothetical protein I4U23_027093 [Adineta vaga]|nr:hypothetical protein I4U23_027093 [Adineta vaga]
MNEAVIVRITCDKTVACLKFQLSAASSGIYRGRHDVLVRLRMILGEISADYASTTTTTTIQLTIRLTDKSAA